ncbi:MerR family transcriptional regulator [Desulforudis sp. 1088]
MKSGATLVRGFTAKDAVKLTGVPYDRLDYWDRSGFLKPGMLAARGKGSKRLYSFRDLVALRTARELRDLGVPLQTLRRVMDYLRQIKELEYPLSEMRLVVAGNDIILVQGEKELLSLLRMPGQGVLQLVYNLPQAVEELRHRIERLGAPARDVFEQA